MRHPRRIVIPVLTALLASTYWAVPPLSAEGLAAAVDAAKKEDVPELIERIKRGSGEDRLIGVSILGGRGDLRAVPYLISVLQGPEEGSRLGAAWGLGELGDPRATEPLIAAMEQNDDNFRAEATEALGKIGDRRATKTLLGLLSDTNDRIRYAAIMALGGIGDPQSIGALKKCLTAEKNASFRAAAAMALESMPAAAVPCLEGALEDKAPRVREAALWSLKAIVAQARGEDLKERSVDHWASALKHKHPQVRRYAAIMLGKLGAPAGVKPLIAAMADSDPGVGHLSAFSLGHIGGEEAISALLDRLKDTEHPRLWTAAAVALAERKEKRAVKPLIEALDAHRLGGVPLWEPAMLALAEIGDPRAIEPIRKNMGIRDYLPVMRAAVLARFGDAESWKHLREAAGSSDETIRLRVATWLSCTRAQPAMVPLTSLLSDSSSRVRRMAAAGLGALSGLTEDSVRALTKALKDEDKGVRQAAKAALEKLSAKKKTDAP
jgi:HEAT repeat protein